MNDFVINENLGEGKTRRVQKQKETQRVGSERETDGEEEKKLMPKIETNSRGEMET